MSDTSCRNLSSGRYGEITPTCSLTGRTRSSKSYASSPKRASLRLRRSGRSWGAWVRGVYIGTEYILCAAANGDGRHWEARAVPCPLQNESERQGALWVVWWTGISGRGMAGGVLGGGGTSGAGVDRARGGRRRLAAETQDSVHSGVATDTGRENAARSPARDVDIRRRRTGAYSMYLTLRRPPSSAAPPLPQHAPQLRTLTRHRTQSTPRDAPTKTPRQAGSAAEQTAVLTRHTLQEPAWCSSSRCQPVAKHQSSRANRLDSGSSRLACRSHDTSNRCLPTCCRADERRPRANDALAAPERTGTDGGSEDGEGSSSSAHVLRAAM